MKSRNIFKKTVLSIFLAGVCMGPSASIAEAGGGINFDNLVNQISGMIKSSAQALYSANLQNQEQAAAILKKEAQDCGILRESVRSLGLDVPKDKLTIIRFELSAFFETLQGKKELAKLGGIAYVQYRALRNCMNHLSNYIYKLEKRAR